MSTIAYLVGTDLKDPADWHDLNLDPGKRAGYMKARAVQRDGIGGADIAAGTKAMDGELAGVYWFKAPEVSASRQAGH